MIRDPIEILLGAQLQEAREQRGSSMLAVRREIRTTCQQDRKYEAGENRIITATLYRLSEILDVGIDELFQSVPTSRVGSSADAPPQADIDALDQIEDREARRHLATLLQALDSRR